MNAFAKRMVLAHRPLAYWSRSSFFWGVVTLPSTKHPGPQFPDSGLFRRLAGPCQSRDDVPFYVAFALPGSL